MNKFKAGDIVYCDRQGLGYLKEIEVVISKGTPPRKLLIEHHTLWVDFKKTFSYEPYYLNGVSCYPNSSEKILKLWPQRFWRWWYKFKNR